MVKLKRRGIYVDDWLWVIVVAYCKRRNVSVSKWIRQLIVDAIED
ncbi:hypothetical protein LCGC14_1825750 [marine sediment metagenome]|uniref:Uncharacterized protein n=1 Tax=marine sediment metagenome TaxID=412755 RepID=A0A0F9GHL1_9ZZZZ